MSKHAIEKKINLQVLPGHFGLLLLSLNMPFNSFKKYKINNISLFDKLEDIINEQCKKILHMDLLGIHDGAIFIKSKELEPIEKMVINVGKWSSQYIFRHRDDEKKLTESSRSYRKEILNEMDAKYSGLGKMIMEIKNPRWAQKPFIKPPNLYSFSFDTLIPFFINEESLVQDKGVLFITFLRLNPRILSMMIKSKLYKAPALYIYQSLTETLNKKLLPHIIGVFSGIGLYQIILLLRANNYKQIQQVVNFLRNDLIVMPEGGRTFHLVEDSSTLISRPSINLKNSEKFHFSLMIKVWPGYDRENPAWDVIKNIANILALGNISIEAKPISISHRQGYFDAIIATEMECEIEKFSDFSFIIGSLLPFVEDTATIIKFDEFVGLIE